VSGWFGWGRSGKLGSGAFRIQNLQRTHVETLCIPVWITPLQTCYNQQALFPEKSNF
jgi:hypothetical protein